MSELWMDVDAALSEVPVNLVALIDDTDFKSREESVVFNQAGLDLLWNFTTTAGVFTQTAVTPTDTAGDYDWVNQGNGYYTIEIPASGGASANNDTEGFGFFSGFATGILPWRGPVIGFRAAALNNALIDGGDLLDVNVTEWLGTAAVSPTTAGVPSVSLTAIGLDDIVSTAVGMVEIAKAIWDRILTGGTHNITQSSGKRLRAIAGTILFEGVATAGSFNSVTLPAGASAVDQFFNNMALVVVDGTGVDQQRIIIDYDGTTKIATISPQWATIPDATSEVEIFPGIVHAAGTNLDLEIGHAASATATTITLNGNASAINDFYNEQLINIHDGAGVGQGRIINDYVGATKVVTIDRAWDTIPDTTSEYIITASITAPHIADHVLDELLSGHTTAGSLGKAVSDTLVDTTDMQPKLGTPAADLSADIAAIPTTAMRGTDGANTTTPPTAAANATAVLTTQMAESYAANGVAPTLAQAQFALHQMLMQFGISGTNITVRKLDDSTTAFIVTLDDDTNPTDAKRV